MKQAQNKKVENYNASEIEKKWQEKWEKEKIYSPNLDTAKKPFYNLMMFPYPSAEGLHVGSVFTFSGVDTYGRFKRMQGYDVFEPMGLDGFGIHSENYALKVGRHPIEQAKRSEENFYRQLRSIGNGFDWSRKLETYDPSYYKWTQWIFVQLFKQGLAYRKKAPVNFCPSCMTVLSDEQVIDGKCERCGTVVEKRALEQWFFKITDYAERLLNNIKDLNWTEKVKIAQREWIGKSEGMEIEFPLETSKAGTIVVYTKFPETIFGVTYMVLAPEHPLVGELTTIEQQTEVNAYIKKAQGKSEIERSAEGKEKTGVFTGSYCINPVNGEKVPVWVADYVIGGYGTGAVMGVPGSDHRDFAFAKQYALPILRVIGETETDLNPILREEQVLEEGILVNSEQFTGLATPSIAREKVKDWLEQKGYGKRKNQYHLRDWLISRQRYWGAPIPMIHCEACGWQPVPEDQLPVLLPNVEDWKPKGNGVSPLANIESFAKTMCPQCGGEARRETDVIDTFLDSAWYFFRYLATELDDKPFDKERTKKWLPVTMYIGGAEHSVLHLLYSRFITMVFKDMGLIDFEEPYARFYAHGLIIKDGAKMSKSKGNVINPDDYIAKYGVDVLRAYLRFVGPFDMGGDFRDSGIEGMERFLNRVWKLFQPDALGTVLSQEGIRIMHKTIKGVTDDLEKLHFNTAIAKLMTWYNYLAGQDGVSREEALVFIQLLAPITPFLAEELWHRLHPAEGSWQSVHQSAWPSFETQYLKEQEATIIVQINGKVRDSFSMPSEEAKDQQQVETTAKSRDRMQQYMQGTVKKVIFVPGKVINFVV